jgi:hypothetical protein
MATALTLIDSIARVRAEVLRDERRSARLERLQRWQIERLRRTYADLAGDARYADALEFFVQDLYGPHEYTQRDKDLRKVLHSWERLLPERASRAVTAALALEALSQNLDLAVVDAVGGAKLTEATYAQAYREIGRRPDRERQIELIVDAGRALEELIEKPAIGAALRLARAPARLAGVMALHTFLVRGFNAFAKMRDAAPLLNAIEERERAIMAALFAGSSRPFDLSAA